MRAVPGASRQDLIDFVVTALVAAPSRSEMAASTQMAMTELTNSLVEDPAFQLAAMADGAKEAGLRMPAWASPGARSFAARWYFAGLTRGVAATIAATERA